jgi:hypothetical protein
MENKESEEKALLDLINPTFTFPFAGTDYEVKKANIEQTQQYYMKLQELTKDDGMAPAVRDLEIAAYCIYLLTSKRYPEVTLQYVKDNTPGTVDVLQLLIQLGFIDPRKATILKEAQQALITRKSSPQ